MKPGSGTESVRPVRRDDLITVATSLARAFDDDPVMTWLVAGGRRRDARMRRFYAVTARQHLRHDGAWTDDSRAAAALWAPPGHWKGTVGDVLRSGPALVSVLRWRLPRALRLVSAMEDVHPREPHWYLGFLGTHPDHQGEGRGGAVMAPVLDRCDRQGVGAYLESSKGSNIPYYQRFGFRVTGEIRLPDGPTLWPMWRAPDDADRDALG